jgi:hypothetical protein
VLTQQPRGQLQRQHNYNETTITNEDKSKAGKKNEERLRINLLEVESKKRKKDYPSL